MKDPNKLSRRNFFQLAGIGAGTAIITPTLLTQDVKAETKPVESVSKIKDIAREEIQTYIPDQPILIHKCVTVTAKVSPYKIQADDTIIITDSTEGPITLILSPGVDGEVHTIKNVGHRDAHPVRISTDNECIFKTYKDCSVQFYFSANSEDWHPVPADEQPLV